MSKFNTGTVRAVTSSPVTTETAPSGRTHEGGPGHARDVKSELFLLAVANMVGEATFYESADDRDGRYRDLVLTAAAEDPGWVSRFLPWLRREANMRTAPLVAAAELVRAKPEGMRTRAVVDGVLQRADEPAELLAYWLTRYGRPIPIALKRGIADAVVRLYTERALLKYDNPEAPLRFGDVIELTQPRYHKGVHGTWRDALYRHAIERRHNRGNAIPDTLPMLQARERLRAIPETERRSALLGENTGQASRDLAAAGMSWESLAAWLQGPMDAAAWEAVIPSMGVFALTRNLRNFDQAGVSDAVAEQVCAKLTDPDVIARSRMFPFRFWSAYKHTDSLRWAAALEKALNLSLANVPSLPGRTLVLVDRSPSMFPGYRFSTPNKSDITLAEQAAVFGAAVALRAEDATLVEFGGKSRKLTVPKAGSVLRLVEQFDMIDATDIPSAVRRHFAGHDRVVVVTDEQTRAGWLPSNCASSDGGMPATRIDELIPQTTPLYMWNFAGYEHGAAPSGGDHRHTFGGLTDQAFRLIPLLESGRNADWPF